MLYNILDFYIERNKSNAYSKKLYSKIQQKLKVLIKNPEAGIKTDVPNIRGLIIENYTVFYEVYQEKIIIHTIWDGRQNPEKLTF